MTGNRDVLITNATVRTVDAHDSIHQAVLVRGGLVQAVGGSAGLAAAAAGAEVVDAGGHTVVPGFVDGHNHLSIAAFSPEQLDCAATGPRSLDDVLERIHDYCRTMPAGRWVVGTGFHLATVAEGRNPTRWELDEAVGHLPFLLMDSSCHAGYLNSAALAAVGISAHTPQPGGGHIETDPDGEPTGVLHETAANAAFTAAWRAQAESDVERAVGLVEAKIRDYLAVGITGVGDALVTPHAAELYRRADAAGMLPVTVQQLHGGDHFLSLHDLRRGDVLARLEQGESDRLRGRAMKIFADRLYPDGGAIDQLHDGCTRHRGAMFYDRDHLHDVITRAGRLGITIATHALGNCALDVVLDGYEAVRRATGQRSTLRVEHAFVVTDGQAERMAALGVDLVANTGLLPIHGHRFDQRRGGRTQPHLRVMPLRSMIDAGVRVSLASDHPCGPLSPGGMLWGAVSRTAADGEQVDGHEAITAADALRALTINPAYAAGRASEEGSIEPGKRANLLILDRDPVTCSPDELRDLQVLRTYVDGRLLHVAGSSVAQKEPGEL